MHLSIPFLWIFQSPIPKGMGGLAACMDRCFAATKIVKIVPREITGKQAHPMPKPAAGCGNH